MCSILRFVSHYIPPLQRYCIRREIRHRFEITMRRVYKAMRPLSEEGKKDYRRHIPQEREIYNSIAADVYHKWGVEKEKT